MSLKFRREKRLIDSIKQNLFVRVQLNQERLTFLKKIRDNNREFDEPIWINEQGVLIDGRHRINVEKARGQKDIECKVFDVRDRVELIAMAFRANRGSLSPTSRDAEHTIIALLDAGCSADKIAGHLDLPISWCRNLIGRAKAAEHRRKLITAHGILINNKKMSISMAASKGGVTAKELQEFLAAKGAKKAEDVDDVKRQMSRLQSSHNQSLSILFRKAIDRHKDGHVDDGYLNELKLKLVRLTKYTIDLVGNIEERIDAILKGDTDPGEPELPPEDLPPRKVRAARGKK